MPQDTSFHSTLAVRERYRDDYWRNNDPIAEDRLLRRAQAFRHAVHLLPGQTILELGRGEGLFTRALLRVCRAENRITAVTFQTPTGVMSDLRAKVELLEPSDFPGSLRGRRFECVVAMDLADRRHASQLLSTVAYARITILFLRACLASLATLRIQPQWLRGLDSSEPVGCRNHCMSWLKAVGGSFS